MTTEDSKADPVTPERGGPPPKSLANLRPWPKGVSGNPGGKPRIEPRVRRYARRYDRRMCQVLAELAEDPKAPWSERRRAAMDLIAVGSGRPALVQEVSGGAPLVNVDLRGAGAQHVGPVTPAEASRVYRAMVAGLVDPLSIQFVPEEEGDAAAALDVEAVPSAAWEIGAPAGSGEAAHDPESV
jgi:hypothetical protein